jgi:F-type H+-transporting ATPase subunit delta
MGLMAAAVEENTLERTGADLELIGRVLGESRDFRLLVVSPVISTARKSEVFSAVFGGRVGHSTLAYLLLLIKKNREEILPAMIEEFRILLNRRLGIQEVDVTAAVELSKAEQEAITARLQAHTGKKVCLKVRIDPGIRGGLVVRVGDTVLDASVSRQLELLRERLAAGAPVNS